MIGKAPSLTDRFRGSQIALLSLGTFLSSVSVYIYVPILPLYALSLGASLSLIGVISGAYGLTQFVLRIPLGVLSDRTQRRKWFVVIGALSGIVSCVGLGISRDPRTFIIWRGMAGIAVTMYVATTALYAAQYDGNNTSRSMGVFMSTISLATAVGPLLGGWAAAGLGWRSPFLLGAILGVIALVPLCAVRDVPSVSVTVEVPLVSGLASLFRRPAIVKAAVLGAVTAFTQFATTMTFVPIRAAQMGADQMQLGLLLFVTMSIFSLASLASGSVIATRIGDQLTLVLGFVVQTVTVFAIPFIPDLLLLTVSQCIGAIGRGMYMPFILSKSLGSSSPREHAAVSGVVMSGMSLGVVIGPIFSGLLADNFGLDLAFICVGLVCSFIIVLLMWYERRSKNLLDIETLTEIGT